MKASACSDKQGSYEFKAAVRHFTYFSQLDELRCGQEDVFLYNYYKKRHKQPPSLGNFSLPFWSHPNNVLQVRMSQDALFLYNLLIAGEGKFALTIDLFKDFDHSGFQNSCSPFSHSDWI